MERHKPPEKPEHNRTSVWAWRPSHFEGIGCPLCLVHGSRAVDINYRRGPDIVSIALLGQPERVKYKFKTLAETSSLWVTPGGLLWSTWQPEWCSFPVLSVEFSSNLFVFSCWVLCCVALCSDVLRCVVSYHQRIASKGFFWEQIFQKGRGSVKKKVQSCLEV